MLFLSFIRFVILHVSYGLYVVFSWFILRLSLSYCSSSLGLYCVYLFSTLFSAVILTKISSYYHIFA